MVEHRYGDADSADLPSGDPGVPRGPGGYRGWRTFPALMKAGKLPMSGEGGEVNLEWVSRAPGRLDLLAAGGWSLTHGALQDDTSRLEQRRTPDGIRVKLIERLSNSHFHC